MVVALLADLPQGTLEIRRRKAGTALTASPPSRHRRSPNRRLRRVVVPASRRASTGFELLMWIKIRRFTPRSRKAAIAPSSPLMLICPIRRPVLFPTPSRIISSSRQRVPSKNTSSLPVRRRRSRSVIAAQPGMKKMDFSVRGVDDLETHRIALFCDSRVLPVRFEIERNLRRHGERDDRYSRRTRGPRKLDPPIEGQFDALDAIRSENMKNRVRRDNRENPRRSINRKAMPLAQVKQPRDGVDIATGDQHAGDRRRPQPFAGMQSEGCLDLQPQIGRGVQNEPVVPVRRDRKRSLRSRNRGLISGARPPTCRRVGIPLRETPAGGRPEDNHFEHRSSRRIRPASENEEPT